MLRGDAPRHSWRTAGMATLAAGTAVMGVVAVAMTMALSILFVVVGYACVVNSDSYQARQRAAEARARDPEGYRREQAKWRTVPTWIPGAEHKVRVDIEPAPPKRPATSPTP